MSLSTETLTKLKEEKGSADYSDVVCTDEWRAIDKDLAWCKENYSTWLEKFYKPLIQETSKVFKIPVPHNFIPRWYQISTVEAMLSKRFVIFCMHRRSGKDYMSISMLLYKALTKVGNYYYLFPKAKQGRKIIWEGLDNDGKRFRDHIPKEFIKINHRSKEHMINNVEMMITLKNGSTIQIVGSDNYDNTIVGTNVAGVIFSEYALSDPMAWGYCRPILAANDGWAWINSTPRGRNHFYKMLDGALYNETLKDLWYGVIVKNSQTNVVSDEELAVMRAEGMSEQMIAQEMECHTPYTDIICKDEVKFIKDVKIGDMVLTHTGKYKRVIKTSSRRFSGRLVVFHTYGNPKPLECTPNHPLKVYIPSERKCIWLKAKDITNDMLLTMPRNKVYKTKLLDEDLIRIVAWYITEGSVNNNAVTFSIGKHEDANIEDLCNSLLVKGFRFSKKIVDNVCNIICCSSQLSKFLSSTCGTLSYNKRMPFELIGGNEKFFFDELIKGDGCHSKTQKNDISYRYSTVSKTLGYQFQILASSLGYRAGMTIRAGGKECIQGRDVNTRDAYCVSCRYTKPKRGYDLKIIPCKHQVAVKIKKIERVEYSGKVYNMEVENDHTFIANGRISHNCMFDGVLDGVIYASQLIDAQKDMRIREFMVDRKNPVYLCFDIGIDMIAVIFVQIIRSCPTVIDFYGAKGASVGHIKIICDEFEQKYGYKYQGIYLPHDGKKRSIVNYDENGVPLTTIDTFRKEFIGIHIETIDRCLNINEDIEICRGKFHNWQFNTSETSDKPRKDRMEYFMNALSSYAYPEASRLGVEATKPIHNWASHPADAFRTGVHAHAIGYMNIHANTWLANLDKQLEAVDTIDVECSLI